jgi:protein SCO1/2
MSLSFTNAKVTRPVFWILTFSLVGYPGSGCSRTPDERIVGSQAGQPRHPDRQPPPAPPPVSDVKEYKLKGEIRKIEKESRQVTIHHQAIPGFMEAMTMPFHMEDASVLDDLRPGDEIEATLRVHLDNGQTKDYELQNLTVTKPALVPPLALDLSGSSPQLRARPKLLELGDPVPDFTMTGQDGKPFKLSDLHGRVVVLTFIYTRCPLPDFCPYMDRKFADLAQSLGAFPKRAEAVRLLSVSFDPDYDTPEILRKHAQIRGGTPPLWTFAVATHDELARITRPLGMLYGPGKNEIIHNLCTAVIDKQGRLARLEVGTQRNKWSSADLLKTIYSLIPSFEK